MIRSGCARSAARAARAPGRDPRARHRAHRQLRCARPSARWRCSMPSPQSRHRYGADAIGLYIVSGVAAGRRRAGAAGAGALGRGLRQEQRRGGARRGAAVRPASSTLERCGAIMRELLEDGVYKRHLEARGRLQTVLIGYSDSNQESGMVASRFAAYRAQRHLTDALRQAHKEHVLFYSRGGSIPRGGGRIDALLRAAPAESVSGVLRFTEQGESISQNYGLRPNAMRTARAGLQHAGAGDAGGQARRRGARERRAGRVRRPGRGPQRPGVAQPGLRAAAVPRLLPRRHADRRHRAHADRRQSACSAASAAVSTPCGRRCGYSPGRSRATCCRPGMGPAPAWNSPRASAASNCCGAATGAGRSSAA